MAFCDHLQILGPVCPCQDPSQPCRRHPTNKGMSQGAGRQAATDACCAECSPSPLQPQSGYSLGGGAALDTHSHLGGGWDASRCASRTHRGWEPLKGRAGTRSQARSGCHFALWAAVRTCDRHHGHSPQAGQTRRGARAPSKQAPDPQAAPPPPLCRCLTPRLTPLPASGRHPAQ